ncbi:hypothetical protein [Microbacterium sp. A93]|uniref:hypothetical protein n=1 Tax=Microbacterium sp. A93 TaxID=3450716 RepID=UPI003F430F45
MRSPESSRHAPEGHASPVRPVRRPSARPFAGASAGSLGEDILLARHGHQILRLRQDHRTGQTVATLRDGTTDAAPNRIEGGVLAPRPGESARLAWDSLTHGGNPESVRELRFLGRLSAIWIAVSLLLGALMVWGMATVMDPAAAEQLMSAYFGAAPLAETGAQTP